MKSALLIPSSKIREVSSAPSGPATCELSNMSRNVCEFATKAAFGTLKSVFSTCSDGVNCQLEREGMREWQTHFECDEIQEEVFVSKIIYSLIILDVSYHENCRKVSEVLKALCDRGNGRW